jgi:hypothetical protein
MVQTTLQINLYELWSLFVTVRWKQTEKKGKFFKNQVQNPIKLVNNLLRRESFRTLWAEILLSGNRFKRPTYVLFV